MNSAELQAMMTTNLKRLLPESGMATEYAHKWKRWTLGTVLPIPAIRAMGIKTSCSGWPTATVRDARGQGSPARTKRLKASGHMPSILCETAQLAGWPTPVVPNGGRNGLRTDDGREGEMRHLESMPKVIAGWPTPMAGNPGTEEYNPAGNTDSSRKTVDLIAGWATPTSRDSKDGACQDANVPINGLLGRQATKLISGPPTTSSPAGTEKRGVLNADHSRWLQGYPAAWGCCGATAIASCRKRRRSSSARTSM